jgi:DnaJ-class molecular chaperone
MVDRRTSRTRDLYKVLDVHPDADAAEIKHAFRRQMHLLHPDKHQADHGATDPDAEERYRRDLTRVYHAYRVLRDPERRAAYDAERAARSSRRRPTQGGSSPRTRVDGTPRPVSERPANSWTVLNLGIIRIEVNIDDQR